MPIVMMSDPIIVPLPVYYGKSDTRKGRPVFPKTGLFYIQIHASERPCAYSRQRQAFNLTKAAGMA
jgi:hypothetical protein